MVEDIIKGIEEITIEEDIITNKKVNKNIK